MKQKVDMSMSVKLEHATVTIDDDALVFDLDATLEALAEAMAEDVKQSIDAQPGSRWDKTGTLKNGIAIEQTPHGARVVGPPGRLGHDKLLERFAAEVLRPDPFDDENVIRALDAVLNAAIKVEK